jgi:uncharacterized protein YjbI with pentapeptide repeats
MTWGRRKTDKGRRWIQKLQRQWSKIWQAVWNGRGQARDQLRRYAFSLFWLIGIIVLVLFIWSLWKFPEWQVVGVTDAAKRVELMDKIRGTIAQIWGAIGIAVGLYFTWRRIAAAERTVQITEEGQITERFTRAIDQLGATDEHGKKRLELRLGGIYALERIARDSEKDHWPIMEVLTAYVHEHARWEDSLQPQQSQALDSDIQPRPDTDIQAILTVLGRRVRWYGKGEDQCLDLGRTDLRGANLSKAHFEGADFNGAHLEGASFNLAHLERADFNGAHLEQAYLINADLARVRFSKAHLEGADFNSADLEGANFNLAHLQLADLRYTNLTEAYFLGADLNNAHLEGVDLIGTKGLTPEQLESAKTDEKTRFPIWENA